MTLPNLAAAEFASVFEAVHGVPPFPWQRRLAERLADGYGWPDALDLPTGSGKTAAIDVALFHLALQADRGPQRQAPLRIAFVVDRRIIVDAAADRAEKIAVALSEAAGDSPLARMAARLRYLAGAEAPPLLVRRLRGGLPREADWARSPGQPTILCSTVDQVGSRLLFRGYGVSDSMKPVHAGLLGSDCLFLLDEAHLAAPFAQTLRRIAVYRAPPWCEATPGPWHFVSLSATQHAAVATFGLDAADRAHPVLRARLKAKKTAELRLMTAPANEAEKDAKARAAVAVKDVEAQTKAFADVAQQLIDPASPSCVPAQPG
jgi:CRISPR-associated endonuclease/helicase Cas3